MLIIGISGKKRSGKDTVAGLLMAKLNRRCEKFNFADPLKAEVCWNYRVSREYLEEHKENFRLILQGHGTDYRRRLFGDTYWIVQWIGAASKLDREGTEILFTTDVRFKNEATTIKHNGGILIRVSRNESADIVDNDKHSSETELDNYNGFDYVIRNDNSLKMLEIEVTNLLEQLKKQRII